MIVALLLALLGAGAPAEAARARLTPSTPWERYLELPTPENARAVQSATYIDRERLQDLDWDLLMLEVQVLSSDSEAVALAFRLRRQSDGHISETLDIMLGRLIRINPQLFLQELAVARRSDETRASPLHNFGFAYVDHEKAHDYEQARRIEALRSVDVPQLRELRNECIRRLGGKPDAGG
ncbi:hypothetical protein ABI59_11110 [Acidobacteria bacterium Mor1]|nr:hypothetical protein ABI59_11110 [Acidobacteria bacterium Mor1]